MSATGAAGRPRRQRALLARQLHLGAVLLQDPRDPRPVLGRDRAVEGHEEVGRAKGWVDLPARAGGLLGGHLVRRAGRDLERLAGAVGPLLAADQRAHGALEDLEALGLA